MICDYLWRRSLEFDGETPPSPSTCQHKRLLSHFEVFVEMSRSKRCRPNGGDRPTSAHFSLGSAHFSATPCYSWTRPLTPIWRSHRGIGCDLRPHRTILQTLNYLDYWTSVTFTALLCIALQPLMAYHTIYDDIGHASEPKLEILNWTRLYGGDLS